MVWPIRWAIYIFIEDTSNRKYLVETIVLVWYLARTQDKYECQTRRHMITYNIKFPPRSESMWSNLIICSRIMFCKVGNTQNCQMIFCAIQEWIRWIGISSIQCAESHMVFPLDSTPRRNLHKSDLFLTAALWLGSSQLRFDFHGSSRLNMVIHRLQNKLDAYYPVFESSQKKIMSWI